MQQDNVIKFTIKKTQLIILYIYVLCASVNQTTKYYWVLKCGQNIL